MIWRLSAKHDCFYGDKTNIKIQRQFIKTLDDEPAGVVVDIGYGFDESYKNGHWFDPQTGYDYTENLDEITVPIFLIAGEKDVSDTEECIKETYEYIGSNDKSIQVIENYGHVDLLMGKNANTDVFPIVLNWLNNQI